MAQEGELWIGLQRAVDENYITPEQAEEYIRAYHKAFYKTEELQE